MNKKTRAVAILLVAVMILSLVASMIIPYLYGRGGAAVAAQKKRNKKGRCFFGEGMSFFLSHGTAAFALFLSARRL